ncbi:MAG: GlxA family transcriptional regulator [Ilumatobacteraceae bacterium]
MIRRIVIVAFPGAQPLDIVGPYEVFAGASSVLRHQGREGDVYVPTLAADGPVRSESGLGLLPNTTLTEARSAGAFDTLVLPGGDGIDAACADREFVGAVAALADHASRIATVCTGTFLAAAAGLVPAGTRVTTHWARAERLAARHPEFTVDAEPIFVRSGRLWTSAGVTSGIDLALAIVEEDHGADVAQTVARWLVMFLRRPGGQSQFATAVWTDPARPGPVREAIQLVRASPGEPHTVEALAHQVGVSARHLQRRFREELGVSPARYVERVRVESARQLLETGADGVETVARSCGFGSGESMRRAFQRTLAVAPSTYRRHHRTD